MRDARPPVSWTSTGVMAVAVVFVACSSPRNRPVASAADGARSDTTSLDAGANDAAPIDSPSPAVDQGARPPEASIDVRNDQMVDTAGEAAVDLAVSCPPGTHACAGVAGCVPVSVDSCGETCMSCGVGPAGSMRVCQDGARCDWQCAQGTKCDGGCYACCQASDCGPLDGNTASRDCRAHECHAVCRNGFLACQGRCLAPSLQPLLFCTFRSLSNPDDPSRFWCDTSPGFAAVTAADGFDANSSTVELMDACKAKLLRDVRAACAQAQLGAYVGLHYFVPEQIGPNGKTKVFAEGALYCCSPTTTSTDPCR